MQRIKLIFLAFLCAILTTACTSTSSTSADSTPTSLFAAPAPDVKATPSATKIDPAASAVMPPVSKKTPIECRTPWLCKDKDCGHWPETGSPPTCRVPAAKLKFISVQPNVTATKTKEERLNAVISLLEKAIAAEGRGVYLLPEYLLCPITGAASVAQNQEPLPGTMSNRFAELATKHNLWIAVGMAETSADPKKPYNTIAILGPHGQVKRYRKTHLFEPGVEGWFRETQLYTPGEALDPIFIEGWRIGVMVCFDGNFPEVPRVLGLKGAQMILYANGRNLVGPEAEVACASNACGVVVANYVGNSGLEQAQGTSRIIVPPWGTVVASIKDASEGWAAKEFTYDEVTRWRNLQVVGRAPVIDPRSRRPELYGPITEPNEPMPAK